MPRQAHTAENRLAKRLFQLEERVDALEEQLSETTALMEMLFGIESPEAGTEISIRFCTCDLDDDEDDE